MRQIAGVIIAAMIVASPAVAQEVGQTVQELSADHPDAEIVAVIGLPGAQMALGQGWHAKICDGVVVAHQYRFGTTLEAFADEVEKETLRQGPPEFDVRHGRSSEGEWGNVGASWTEGDRVTVIGITSSARGMEVSRATTALESHCFAVLW